LSAAPTQLNRGPRPPLLKFLKVCTEASPASGSDCRAALDCPECGASKAVRVMCEEGSQPFAETRTCDCSIIRINAWIGKRCNGTLPRPVSKPPATLPSTNGNGKGHHAPAPMPTTAPEIADPWEDFVPLERQDRPAFPVEVLPLEVQEMVRAVSEATQTPVDCSAMMGLSVVAAAVAKRVETEPRDGWREPLVLWTAGALPPGSMKSAVDGEMKAPIIAHQDELTELMRDEVARSAVARHLLEKRLESLKTKATNTDDNVKRRLLQDEAEAVAVELARTKQVFAPRLLCEDVTPERLGMLMHEQGGRMAVLSSEGTIFIGMAGYYNSGTTSLDIYKKGHSGDAVTVDRVGRPSIQIPRPALTMGLLIQPDVIARLSDRKEMRGEGLLARFLYAMPRSWVGERNVEPDPIPDAVRTAYHKKVRHLLEMPADTDEKGNPRPHTLLFDKAAQGAIRDYRKRLEPMLGKGGELEHLADWGGKLHGALVRIAALLHLTANAGTCPKPWKVAVDRREVERAAQVCDYLIAHAKIAFGMMSADPALAGARTIWEWIARQDAPIVTLRDIHRGVKRSFPKPADLDVPLSTLIDLGYIRQKVDRAEKGSSGGRTSVKFEVNPKAKGQG
jgi:replicative DNA helicase